MGQLVAAFRSGTTNALLGGGVLLLQLVLAVIACRRLGAVSRVQRWLRGEDPLLVDPELPRVPRWPAVVASASLLLLPAWSALQLTAIYGRATAAFGPVDPSQRATMLGPLGPDLPAVLSLCALFTSLAAFGAAVVLGATLAARSRAAGLARAAALLRGADAAPGGSPESEALARYPGLSARTTLGLCLAFVALVVTPAALGVIAFFARWFDHFSQLATMAPPQKYAALLAFVGEPRALLRAHLWVAVGGLAVVTVAACWIFARRRRSPTGSAPALPAPREPRWSTVLAAVAPCLLAAAALLYVARPFVFDPPAAPAGGPVARLLAATGRPPGWGSQAAAMLAESKRRGHLARHEVLLSRRALLLDFEQVTELHRGEVPAAAKPGGRAGLLIQPLVDGLQKISPRRRGDSLRVTFVEPDLPAQLLEEVIASASKAGVTRVHLWEGDTSSGVALPGRGVAQAAWLEQLRRPLLHLRPWAPRPRLDVSAVPAPPKPPPPSAEPVLAVVAASRGFIVADPQGVVRSPSGNLPTIPCPRPLGGRCAGRDAGGRWFDRYDRGTLKTLVKTRLARNRAIHSLALGADRLTPIKALLATLDTLAPSFRRIELVVGLR